MLLTAALAYLRSRLPGYRPFGGEEEPHGSSSAMGGGWKPDDFYARSTQRAKASPRGGAHLVVAVIVPRRATAKGPPRPRRPGADRKLMREMIDALNPIGHFAVVDSQDVMTATVQCAFMEEWDAIRLAQLVRGRRTGRYGGWESHTAFFLDENTRKIIRAALRAERNMSGVQPLRPARLTSRPASRQPSHWPGAVGGMGSP